MAGGTLFAGLLAALAAAYTRRELAAWRARLNGYLLARKLATEKAPEKTDNTPLPRHPHLLLDGEVPLDEATSGRVPQPEPSRPDGSYTPHGLRDGYAPAQPVDLAAWKQQDYNQLARHQAAEAADRAFDAEVGEPTSAFSQRSWWQQMKEGIQHKVKNFVMHPPSWLSVSYTATDFSLAHYTITHWVTYQPLAENFLQTITYQRIEAESKIKETVTTNPTGWLDVDFGDGTITFKGKYTNFFIQPGALSFGWQKSPSPQIVNEAVIQPLSITTIDFDVLGKNWGALKVSHASGTAVHTSVTIDGTEIEQTHESTLKVEIQVHRWPRIFFGALVGVGVAYVAFEVGALEAVAALGGAVVEHVTGLWAKIPTLLPGGGLP